MADELNAHVYLEDRPLGAYVADMKVTIGRHDDPVEYGFQLSLDELEGLELHIKNALHALRWRMLRDAIAGDCRRCQNTRMVNKISGSREVHQGYHCPICTPKIEKVMSAIRAGHPPKFKKAAAKKTKAKS